MADNVRIKTIAAGGANISTEEVTTLNGAAVTSQQAQRMLAALRTADGAAIDLPGDAANGLDVDVTRLPAVALDGATLAALETIQVGNHPADPATQTTLAAILAKLIAAPATEATLAAVLAAVDGLEGLLTRGAFGYAAGTAAGTVDVPAGARVRYVTVLAGAGAATLTIAGGAMITIPAGGSFERELAGDAPLGADVVIGGTVASYFVEWAT